MHVVLGNSYFNYKVASYMQLFVISMSVITEMGLLHWKWPFQISESLLLTSVNVQGQHYV